MCEKNDWGQEYLLYGLEHHVRTRSPTITSCDFLVIEQSSSFQSKCNQVPFLKTLNLLVRSNMEPTVSESVVEREKYVLERML